MVEQKKEQVKASQGVVQSQRQFEQQLQGQSSAGQIIRQGANIIRKIPEFKAAQIKQGRTINLAPNYTKQQMALKQMFGGGEHIWGSGTQIYTNEGHLRRGVGLTNMDVRRDTRRLFLP